MYGWGYQRRTRRMGGGWQRNVFSFQLCFEETGDKRMKSVPEKIIRKINIYLHMRIKLLGDNFFFFCMISSYFLCIIH